MEISLSLKKSRSDSLVTMISKLAKGYLYPISVTPQSRAEELMMKQKHKHIKVQN